MKKSVLTIALAVILAVSVCANAYLLYQDLSPPPKAQSVGSLYHRTIAKICDANANNTFAPPVSLNDALQIAFNRTSWTDDKLMEFNATTVDARIVYGYIDQSTKTTIIVGALQTPVSAYSDFTVDGMAYQYMWQIVAYNNAADLMPQSHDGYCLIDVQTGEFMPIPAS
jgi:hypothetical protein